MFIVYVNKQHWFSAKRSLRQHRCYDKITKQQCYLRFIHMSRWKLVFGVFPYLFVIWLRKVLDIEQYVKNKLICKSVTSFVYSFVFIHIFACSSVPQLDINCVKLSFYASEYIYDLCCTCRHFRCNTSIFW